MSDHAVLVFLCAIVFCWSIAAFAVALWLVRRVFPVFRGAVALFDKLRLRDPLTLLLLASVAALMFLPGCASPGAGMDAVFDAWERVSADGLVTKDEAAFFAGVMREALGDYGSVDWPTTIVGLLGSAASAFFGVNLYRNKRELKVWGPPTPPAPAPTETPAA